MTEEETSKPRRSFLRSFSSKKSKSRKNSQVENNNNTSNTIIGGGSIIESIKGENEEKEKEHEVVDDTGSEYSEEEKSISGASNSNSNSKEEEKESTERDYRPRFDSKVSWADSTSLDHEAELSGRPSLGSVADLSKRSTTPRRGGDNLSNISEEYEGWNEDELLASYQEQMDEQPIKEQVEKMEYFTNEYTKKLRDIQDAISGSITDLWGLWSDPIQLSTITPERVDVQDLIQTDNELFNKVMTVFSVLCDEISELKLTAQTNFYPVLLMYGQKQNDVDPSQESEPGEDELSAGSMIPFFQDISNFVDRCYAITTNLIHQLASLYHDHQKLYKSTFTHVHLRPVIDSLGDLLSVLITLDAIILDNSTILLHWDKFKRMMQHARSDPSKFGTSINEIKNFERLLVNLDRTVMDGQVFQGCIEQDFEESVFTIDEEDGEKFNISSNIDVRNNNVFLNELIFCIRERFEEQTTVISDLTTSQSEENIFPSSFPTEVFAISGIIGTYGLYALYRHLLPPSTTPDEEFYLKLWEMQLKVPCVIICGKILWGCAEFLLKHAPLSSSKKLSPSDVQENRRNFLVRMDDLCPSFIVVAYKELCCWLIRMDSYMTTSVQLKPIETSKLLHIRGQLLMTGLFLASKVQWFIHLLVNLHVSSCVPMSKSIVRPLYQGIEILKAIEFEFARKNSYIAESLGIIKMLLGKVLQNLYKPIKSALQMSKRFDDAKLDMLASVTLIEEITEATESYSFTRLLVLNIAMHISFMQADKLCDNLKLKRVTTAHGHLRRSTNWWYETMNNPLLLHEKLSYLSDFHRQIKIATDCSFLYFHKELLPAFLEDIYALPDHIGCMQYVIGGFMDAVHLFRHTNNTKDWDMFTGSYQKLIEGAIQQKLLDPLCEEIENDLRLHIHSIYLQHVESPSPLTLPDFKVLNYYLTQRPLRLLNGRILDVRRYVVEYLEKTFYNLTTVALHDWKTYNEMKHLANIKYGLQLHETYLPMGTLEQGLDVLQIMRNIHIFTANYNYNLNQQFFIEKRAALVTNASRGAKKSTEEAENAYGPSSSRHLNTITIHSIASSIRTHGIGIMNTTINFTYQFLLTKFNIFSQFLFDEYIKSYLQKERRWFKQNKNSVDQRYPFDRATEFVKEIRKLGLTDSGKTFLDSFRLLITEIGNALGFVRMVRSASMNYCSRAAQYIPASSTPNGKREVNYLPSSHFLFERNMVNENRPAVLDENGNVLSPAIEGGSLLTSDTLQAAKNIDAVISNLDKNFGEGIDYFQILVQVFDNIIVKKAQLQPQKGDDEKSLEFDAMKKKLDEQKHLHNFYQIIPALAVSYIENSIQAKDLMYKNSRRRESYFTDDGFAIGIAYILAILDQGDNFDSLHWFEEASRKFDVDALEYQKKQEEREERKKARSNKEQHITEMIDEEEEVHALQLTAKRIELQRREFDLLNWSLNGARIFFKH